MSSAKKWIFSTYTLPEYFPRISSYFHWKIVRWSARGVHDRIMFGKTHTQFSVKMMDILCRWSFRFRTWPWRLDPWDVWGCQWFKWDRTQFGTQTGAWTRKASRIVHLGKGGWNTLPWTILAWHCFWLKVFQYSFSWSYEPVQGERVRVCIDYIPRGEFFCPTAHIQEEHISPYFFIFPTYSFISKIPSSPLYTACGTSKISELSYLYVVCSR